MLILTKSKKTRPGRPPRKPSELSKYIGQRIKAIKEKEDVSSYHLALSLGVTHQVIETLERGFTSKRFEMLAKIGRGLEIDLNALKAFVTCPGEVPDESVGSTEIPRGAKR